MEGLVFVYDPVHRAALAVKGTVPWLATPRKRYSGVAQRLATFSFKLWTALEFTC